MSRTLISRPNVEKLVRMADLDLAPRTGTARDELIDNVMRSMQLERQRSTTCTSSLPRPESEQAHRKWCSRCLPSLSSRAWATSGRIRAAAVKFLDDQIKRYEDTLKAAENRLKDFKMKSMGVAGQDRLLRPLRAAAAPQIEDAQARAARRRAGARLLQAASCTGETPTFLPEVRRHRPSNAFPELDARIAALKVQLDDLLRKYTDQHPDVMAAKRLIDAARRAAPGVARRARTRRRAAAGPAGEVLRTQSDVPAAPHLARRSRSQRGIAARQARRL